MPSTIENIEFHGLKALRLHAASGATAIISLYGAQILSWITPDRRERLFLSDQALFDMKSAIRGGIPVSFPQFSGLGTLPKHGFARQHLWTATERQSGGDHAMVSLEFRDDDATRALWPHAFNAELTVAIEDSRLDVELGVDNRGDEPISFTCALHSYLNVKEVEEVALEGLYGLEYRDAADADKIKKDNGPTLHVSSEVDRVYHHATRPLLLRDADHSLGINTEGFADVVIWNPWEALSAQLEDMPDDGFRHMLCIEAAAADSPIRLESGESWWGRQSLVVLDAK